MDNVMDIIYSQSQKIFNSDKISSLQHAKKNDTVSVTHVSNIISHPTYTNKIGIELSHFPSNPSSHTITMWRMLRTLPCYAGREMSRRESNGHAIAGERLVEQALDILRPESDS